MGGKYKRPAVNDVSESAGDAAGWRRQQLLGPRETQCSCKIQSRRRSTREEKKNFFSLIFKSCFVFVNEILDVENLKKIKIKFEILQFRTTFSQQSENVMLRGKDKDI